MYRTTTAFLASSFAACLDPAFAAVTFFDDEAAFAAASGPVATEDFEGFASDASFQSAPLDLGAFSLSTTGAFSAFVDTPPFQFPSDAPGTGNFVQLTGSGYSTTITFDLPIFSFGLIATGIGVGNTEAVRTVLEVGGETYVPDQDGLTQFIGFLSDMPITEIVFQTTFNDGWKLDDIRYSSVAPPDDVVPIPAAAFLFAPAVAGLAFARRKGAAKRG